MLINICLGSSISVYPSVFAVLLWNTKKLCQFKAESFFKNFASTLKLWPQTLSVRQRTQSYALNLNKIVIPQKCTCALIEKKWKIQGLLYSMSGARYVCIQHFVCTGMEKV